MIISALRSPFTSTIPLIPLPDSSEAVQPAGTYIAKRPAGSVNTVKPAGMAVGVGVAVGRGGVVPVGVATPVVDSEPWVSANAPPAATANSTRMATTITGTTQPGDRL